MRNGSCHPHRNSGIREEYLLSRAILIHDGHHRNPQADRRYAIEATRRIIENLQPQGYEFSTLCEIAH
jgi:peptidoglycan/xylan/chitin deacetylase (PgdA/CDA1 family)